MVYYGSCFATKHACYLRGWCLTQCWEGQRPLTSPLQPPPQGLGSPQLPAPAAGGSPAAMQHQEQLAGVPGVLSQASSGWTMQQRSTHASWWLKNRPGLKTAPTYEGSSSRSMCSADLGVGTQSASLWGCAHDELLLNNGTPSGSVACCARSLEFILRQLLRQAWAMALCPSPSRCVFCLPATCCRM